MAITAMATMIVPARVMPMIEPAFAGREEELESERAEPMVGRGGAVIEEEVAALSDNSAARAGIASIVSISTSKRKTDNVFIRISFRYAALS